MTAVLAFLVIAAFVLVIGLGRKYFETEAYFGKAKVMLEGEYSVDGGVWKPVGPSTDIREHFHRVTMRGKLSEQASAFEMMAVSSKDVWFTLASADGSFEISNRRTLPDIPEEYFWPVNRMPNTPGFEIMQVDTLQLPESVRSGSEEMILEVEYPYEIASKSFSDCFSVFLCGYEGPYNQLFFKSLPVILLFVLVCFFGLFFFPVTGFVLGKINYRYLCFGFLCFFWGIYMILQSLGDYLNLWVIDPTICLFAVRMIEYLFITSIFLYLKSNMEKPVTRAIGNMTALAFFLMVCSAAVLHLAYVLDLTATGIPMFAGAAVCAVIMAALLFAETRGNRGAAIFLLSWSPLMLCLLLDILDQFIHLAGERFFNYGLAVTMIYLIVRSVLDLRKQYLEAIRYQKMQKELYEAKVSVMVSQIQPHFMYNALTSIAMMCQIDPDTAQEATITFAKYLRGNMDSLKKTAPVPFKEELEHLKKYLYIEKLRFGDKLNIVYDIQAEDFVLPLLSIQPLVENAVKHGVGMKKKGGTVTIATRKTPEAYEVIISDDGVGFDTTAPRPEDGRSHVGMENTIRRIREMCGGEVKIESTVGEGTTAAVVLPKEGQTNEDSVSG